MVDHHFQKKYTSTYIRYNLVWDTCLGDTPLLVGFIDFDLVVFKNFRMGKTNIKKIQY